MPMWPLKAQGLPALCAVLGTLVAHVLDLLRNLRHRDSGRCGGSPCFPLFPFAYLGFPTADV
eukprot:5786770-Lingulodinium_polyedra.AAC.1